MVQIRTVLEIPSRQSPRMVYPGDLQNRADHTGPTGTGHLARLRESDRQMPRSQCRDVVQDCDVGLAKRQPVAVAVWNCEHPCGLCSAGLEEKALGETGKTWRGDSPTRRRIRSR